jgi:hypothetical protein
MTAFSIVTSTARMTAAKRKDLSPLEKWEEEWQMSFQLQKCSHQDSYKPTTCHTNTTEDFTPSRSTSCFRLLRNEDIQASVVPSIP